ncbi:MAG: fimbrillin family protein [Bacteroidaceae bacterium]|nr:fimbrillin family protein [Bacteroidaceae bacterium]
MLSYKQMMLAMASCVIAASCSNTEEKIYPIKDNENVSFTASMKKLSRATETEFEEGDEIAVYAVQEDENGNTLLKSSGNYANFISYTYSGGKFVNENGIARPTEFGVRYFAIYPKSAGSSVPTNKFYVKTNQSASGQYTLSDYCTAVSEVTMEKDVNLIFSHRMSHAIINLEGEGIGTGTPTVKLNNVNTGCDIDLNANTFIAFESRSAVYCEDNGTNSYKAIIVPQTIEEGSPFISVTLNNKEYVLKAASDIVFASGKQQVFNLVIKKDEIVSYTSSILPWGQEDERIGQVIPDDIRQKMEAYIPIYDGVNPPNVEGCYYISPFEAVYCEDGGFDPGDLVEDSYINLTSQSKDNTIDMEEFAPNSGSYSIGEGAFICGEGDNFTIFFNTEGISLDIYNRTALLISGTKSTDGIKNLKYAFVMVEKGDDPENVLMEEGIFRVFQDQDGISSPTVWPGDETRAGAWLPKNSYFINEKARAVRK